MKRSSGPASKPPVAKKAKQTKAPARRGAAAPASRGGATESRPPASKKRPLGQGNAIPRNLRDHLISGTGAVAPAGVVSGKRPRKGEFRCSECGATVLLLGQEEHAMVCPGLQC